MSEIKLTHYEDDESLRMESFRRGSLGLSEYLSDVWDEFDVLISDKHRIQMLLKFIDKGMLPEDAINLLREFYE